MRCAWWSLGAAAVAVGRAAAACVSSLQAPSATAWRAACDDAFVALDPSRVQTYYLAKDAKVRVATTEVFLPATFGRVDALASPRVTSLTLKAEPLWVHKTPVTIVAEAFAELSALETLMLENVPLADRELHLVLPRSIRKIVIVSCRLQRFSFEIVDGGKPSDLLEVDLHSNELVEIPQSLFLLPSNVINLDIRLNKLPTISVEASQSATLTEWMKKGVLQVDNVKNPCPKTSESAQVQGLSQMFEICVLEDSDALSSNDEKRSEADDQHPSNHQRNASITMVSETGNEAVDLDEPPASVHSPIVESGDVPSAKEDRQVGPDQDTVTKTGSALAKAPAIYVALICLGVVSAVLMSFSIVLVVARYRQQSNRKDRGKSGASVWTSAATEDFSMTRLERGMSDAGSETSENMMVTPLPTFKDNSRVNRAGRSFSEASAPATPIHRNGGNSLYSTLATPHSKSHGYIMSKSLQSLTGVSHFSITSYEKHEELRQANKEKMLAILSDLSKKKGTIEVNKMAFTCQGEVVETEVGALMISCYSTPDGPTTQPFSLKVYVEQDIRVAIKEYRALLVMQSNTCKQFVSQMVATEMETRLGGLKCAVIVVERGSQTTFRHIVRGQINRTKQFEVVQQLHAVVKALECLHERQFIHGGLHLDALVVHPSEANRLKFRNLEHAARFGDIIPGTASQAMLEYVPPEMARHLVCSGDAPRPASFDTMTAESYQILRASSSYDVWCMGIMILKIYASTKHLDEFDGCTTPDDYFLKLSNDEFDFERSLQLYVHHEDVRDLARTCLRRDPRRRPKLTGLLNHRVFRAYDRLGEGDLVASFHAHQLKAANKAREALPPTLWFFLPPHDLGLKRTRTVDEWVSELTDYQQQLRQEGRFRTGELMFPLLFMCENSQHVNAPCSNTGPHNASMYLPASLLSLAMPIVQESTLFLEAKSIVAENPKLDIAQVSGLGMHQWGELIKFYRALEKMMLAPISSFSLLLLKPLEEMLAHKDPESARQVLDELKCLIFSQEKRDHVLSLLDILRTISVNSDLDEGHEESDTEDAELASVSEDGDLSSSQRPTKEWSRLRKCEVESENTASMPPARWLCRRHWECEMECEV